MAEDIKVQLNWEEGLRFNAQGNNSNINLKIDSASRSECAGPSPMELFLMGVASCTAMDVVAILQKMRQPLERFSLEAVGKRADKHPKFYREIVLIYHLWGEGLDRQKVERAVKLSHETYCSAMVSLRPDCRIETDIQLH